MYLFVEHSLAGRRRASDFMVKIFARVSSAVLADAVCQFSIAKMLARVSSTVWKTPCVGFYS